MDQRRNSDFDPRFAAAAHLDAASGAPDLIGPVQAFRDWRVTADGLCSPRTDALWTSRTMSAQCRPQTVEDLVLEPHESPGAGCSCGIHAYYELSDAASKIDWRGVSGIVTVWGRVEAYSTGLRAEYARVEALGTYARWTRRQKDAVAAVAAELDVELLDLYDLAREAPRFGSPLPGILVPGSVRPKRPGHAGTGAAPRAERRFVVAA
jgi:hypothetical protein